MITRRHRPAAVATLLLSAALLAGCAVDTVGSATAGTPPGGSASPVPTSVPTDSTGPAAEASPSIESRLRYLIEEEKLAHDVYVALGDLWGARIFENIAASERTHEDAVAELLSAYGLQDPRSAEPGVFTDPDLQALYDDLVDAGSRSLADAVHVGITIERTDIADLSAAMPGAPADVATLVERLLAASWNHLAAFERQG